MHSYSHISLPLRMRGAEHSMLKARNFKKQQLGDWGTKLCQECIYPWDSCIVRLKRCKFGIAVFQYGAGLWPKMLCACCAHVAQAGPSHTQPKSQSRFRSLPYHSILLSSISRSWLIWAWSRCGICASSWAAQRPRGLGSTRRRRLVSPISWRLSRRASCQMTSGPAPRNNDENMWLESWFQYHLRQGKYFQVGNEWTWWLRFRIRNMSAFWLRQSSDTCRPRIQKPRFVHEDVPPTIVIICY